MTGLLSRPMLMGYLDLPVTGSPDAQRAPWGFISKVGQKGTSVQFSFLSKQIGLGAEEPV